MAPGQTKVRVAVVLCIVDCDISFPQDPRALFVSNLLQAVDRGLLYKAPGIGPSRFGAWR